MDQQCSSMQTDASQMELDQIELQTRMERIGKKYLVLSGKGGVGKSTVAANLAFALADEGKRVGLLDVDLHGPSITKILGLDSQRLGADANGGIAPMEITPSLKVVSVGMLLQSADDAVIWRGPRKYGVIQQFLKDVNWGSLDALVVDSPPGTGDEPLAVAQLIGRGASAVIVTTPQDVAIADVRRSVSFCNTLSLPIAGIIENMSGMVCPHCNETVDLFKSGGGKRLAETSNVAFLGNIPLDPRVVASGDTGSPLVREFPESPSAKAFGQIVENLLQQQQTQTSETPSFSEKNVMKIAVPTAEGKLAMHFGHCETFAIIDVDEDGKVINVEHKTPPPHEPGVLPRWLGEQGANLIIAGGMGQRAQNLFQRNGVEVVVGAPSEEPEKIVAAYIAGTLETGDNVCDH